MPPLKRPRHPSIYEINTRVWLRKFDTDSHRARLSDVPDTYWDYLLRRGIDYVWLMGIWATNELEYDRQNTDSHLISQYRKSLPDFVPDDVVGSPYAIDVYQINPEIGSEDDLLQLKDVLNKKGMGVILDFVPNHFGRHSRYTVTHPQYFVQGTENDISGFPNFFFRSPLLTTQFFAHGRDPYYGEWVDTVQLNYCHPEAREFMESQLKEIVKYCDGVRCDMAMMILKEVFEQTWGPVVPHLGFSEWEPEFWKPVIEKIKTENPEFVFIAEVYWNKERDLIAQGFDFCYDKTLLDKITSKNPHELCMHLQNQRDLIEQSVHFLENHDEARIRQKLDISAIISAAGLISFLPGMRFYHDGQWEGNRYFNNVHLARAYSELPCPCPHRSIFQINSQNNNQVICACNSNIYKKMSALQNRPIFKEGNCALFLPIVVDRQGTEISGLFTMTWSIATQKIFVIINFNDRYIQACTELGTYTPQAPRVVDHFNEVQPEVVSSFGEIHQFECSFEILPFGISILEIDDR